MDARKFAPKTKGFRKPVDLQVSGPCVLTVKQAEVGEGYPDRDTGIKPKQLHLHFTDGSRVALGSKQIFDQAMALLGSDTATWPGQMVEVFCDMTVSSPKGQGGVRLRAPAGMSTIEDEGSPYLSDLVEEE